MVSNKQKIKQQTRTVKNKKQTRTVIVTKKTVKSDHHPTGKQQMQKKAKTEKRHNKTYTLRTIGTVVVSVVKRNSRYILHIVAISCLVTNMCVLVYCMSTMTRLPTL
jgi:hypothetical protein